MCLRSSCEEDHPQKGTWMLYRGRLQCLLGWLVRSSFVLLVRICFHTTINHSKPSSWCLNQSKLLFFLFERWFRNRVPPEFVLRRTPMGIERPTRGIFQTIQKAKSHMRAWKSTTTNLKTLKTETQEGEAFREEKQRARSRSPCFANFCCRYGTCWNLSRGGRRQGCAVVQRIEMIWPCQLARELPSYMYCIVLHCCMRHTC